MASILIVDDYPVTQRVLRVQLTTAGHSVQTASNGKEALEKLSNRLFDLAILDIAMPDMDGITLLGLIRSDQRHTQMPVFMLTASSVDQDRVRARLAGASRFLNKPTSTQELLQAVRECLAPMIDKTP